MASPLIRAALMVRDLDRSCRFYREALGLTATYLEADLSETGSQHLLGLAPSATVRAAILKAPHIAGRDAPDFGMVGLFELKDPTLAAARPRVDGVVLGEAVLVFYVADLRAAMERVKALGGSILTEPARFQHGDINVGELIGRDPDGVALNLVETKEALAWSPG